MVESGRQAMSSAKEILVVEDHEETAAMLTMLLEDEGYRVRRVSTAGEALRHLAPARYGANGSTPKGEQGERPDLVLLDLTLPDMDPVTMISQARNAASTTPPIIVVSARSVGSVQEAAREIGAVSVLHKPFPISALLGYIEQALEG